MSYSPLDKARAWMSVRHTTPFTASLLLAAGTIAGCPPQDEPNRQPDTNDTRPSDENETDEPEGPDATEEVCGTAKVDLLFVIDNSGSMSEEQAKLARTVPELLGILATGNRNGKRSRAGEPTDFVPAESIHVGVISTDLGVNGAPAQNSCGDKSFLASDPDPARSAQRVNKPLGDDGQLLHSTAVAVAGIYGPALDFTSIEELVPPEPSCAEITLDKPYIEYEPGDLFENTGSAFSCISRLGRNGCGLEQQLESMLKALTPSDSKRFTFSGGTHGQGTRPGTNAGFLREDAILAVVQVSDEEDCSVPDESRAVYDAVSTAIPGQINVRCGMPENQTWLHPVERYHKGLLALKPKQYQDRIIFAGIVGVPLAVDLDGHSVQNGQEALSDLLARPDMQFSLRRNRFDTDEPVPTCTSPIGDGSAAPARRTVELAKALGDNGVITSICEESYQPLITLLSERISSHLGGGCE